MICHLGLGSNLGDRLAHLQSAVACLARHGLRVQAASSVYETSPVGCTVPQPDYLNAAVAIETDLDPHRLVSLLLEIERELGRTRPARNTPRSIDLDLLLVGQTESTDAQAVVPHPRLHERLFVLEPLCDIAGEALHPVLHTPMTALRDQLRASGTERVRLFAPAYSIMRNC